jgi:hypothetical protein
VHDNEFIRFSPMFFSPQVMKNVSKSHSLFI